MPGTTSLGIPYPVGGDSPQAAPDMQSLATAVNALIVADRARLDPLETPADTAWATPVSADTTLWVVTASRYRRLRGFVSVHVQVQRNGTAANLAQGGNGWFFTLPTGFRPAFESNYLGWHTSGAAPRSPVNLTMQTNGDLRIISSNVQIGASNTVYADFNFPAA